MKKTKLRFLIILLSLLLMFLWPSSLALAQDVTPVIPVEIEPGALVKIANLLVGVAPLAVIVFGIVEGLKTTIKNFVPQYEEDKVTPTWYYPLALRLVAFLVGVAVASISMDQLRALPYLELLPDVWMVIFGGVLSSVDSNILHRAAEFLMMAWTKFFAPAPALQAPTYVQSTAVRVDGGRG